jgi:TolB protein
LARDSNFRQRRFFGGFICFQKMAFVSRISGSFKLHTMELATGKASAITDTSADEHPCFSPNRKQLIYATKIQGRETLMTTTLDGVTKAKLAANPGEVREPSWGPLIGPSLLGLVH